MGLNRECNNYFEKGKFLKGDFNGYIAVIIILILLSIISQVSSEESVTTYYVPDDYATIQEAINVAQTGDCIIVKTAVYTESIYIDKPLTIKGQGSPEINANGSYYCFELRSDGILIDNFKITNIGSNGNKAGIRIISNNNIIQNCKIQNNANYGILIYKNVSGNIIKDTLVTKNYYGIYIDSASSNTISNCIVNKNDIYGIHLRYATENLIQSNTISDEIVGVYLWESYDNIITENTVNTCDFHGIDLRKSDENVIFNNVFNSSKNAYDTGENNWNAEILQDTNIIGGPYIGGNYWSDYSGFDNDANGIGNTYYVISGGDNTDYYPLYYQPNYAPFPSGNPNPVNGASNIKQKLSISWECSDPDGDECWYELYLGTTSSSIQKIATVTDSMFSIDGLDYDQTYHWRIIAFDNTTENHSTASPIYHFSTIAKPSSSDSSSSGRRFQNIPPNADLSAGEPYIGFVDQLLVFDASASHDYDGIIEEYQWDFGDNSKANGQFVQHSYKKEGEYTVVLTVLDNYGFSDTETCIAVISKANIPPEKLEITGPKIGLINSEYMFQLTAIDKDNDTIKYIIDWGDSQITESALVPNSTTYNATHNWSTAGIYKINAKVSDNKTESSITSINMLVNAIYVLEKGYLLDENNDGIYDSYQSNQTDTTNSVETKQDDIYLIDDNGDGEWDYEFVVTTQQLSSYDTSSSVQDKDNIVMILLIGIVVAIIMIILAVIVYRTKKNK